MASNEGCMCAGQVWLLSEASKLLQTFAGSESTEFGKVKHIIHAKLKYAE